MRRQGQLSTVGTRLRTWRKINTDMKAYQLAKRLKISQGSMSDIENNISLPSATTLASLHNNTNISIIWLLTAKGNQFQE